MLLFSHPAPTRAVQHAACALSRTGLAGEFWTRSGTWLPLLQQRDTPDAVGCIDRVTSLTGGISVADPEASQLLDDKMRVRLSRGKFDCVYAYEHGAEATFRAAARADILCVYEIPQGNWRGTHPILTEEAARQPAWASTLGISGTDSDALRKTQSELAAADLVLVGSSFALQTLEETSDLPGVIAVAAAGAPAALAQCDQRRSNRAKSDTLRVLYAGPLSQRSGLSYVFDACGELGSAIALTIIAPPPIVPCRPLRRELDRVRWLATASMEVVRQEMGSADVFLIPAVYDTSSDLLLCALAAGLPIIATPHSAAPDLIRDGKEGYIVPIRSADSIAAKLDALRSEPDLRAEMSQQAVHRAHGLSWQRYEQVIIASVTTALAQRGVTAVA